MLPVTCFRLKAENRLSKAITYSPGGRVGTETTPLVTFSEL